MSDVIVSAKGIIVYKDTFLILKQTRPDMFYWDLPGGKVEYLESPENALLREAIEETGLKISIDTLCGVWWFTSPTKKQHVVCITYLCHSETNTVDILHNPADSYTKEFKWVTKEEFLTGDYFILNNSLHSVISKITL